VFAFPPEWVFAFRTECCSESQRNGVRLQNGIAFAFDRIPHLDPSYRGAGLSSVSSMEREVWNEYANRPSELHFLASSIRHALMDGTEELLNTGTDAEEGDFPEGAFKYRQHVTRERNRELILRAKDRAKQRLGKLYCEACGFDFEAVYGTAGRDYIQCHHIIPVCDLEPGDITRIADIVLLCANCHCMVHRRRPWLRMEELRLLLKTHSPTNEQ